MSPCNLNAEIKKYLPIQSHLNEPAHVPQLTRVSSARLTDPMEIGVALLCKIHLLQRVVFSINLANDLISFVAYYAVGNEGRGDASNSNGFSFFE